MESREDFFRIVEDICTRDSRYKPDAYEFLLQALHYTQKKLKKEKHVTGRELLEGVRDFSIEQYGPMVKTVFNHWGITNTEDFGNIVFNMVNVKLLSKTEEDSLEDFKDVYDFDTVFSNVIRDSVMKGLK